MLIADVLKVITERIFQALNMNADSQAVGVDIWKAFGRVLQV